MKQEPRWLVGNTPTVEARLIRCIARWNGSRDQWALYAITFNGRETLDRKPKQFLNDTEQRVVLDDLTTLELIGTDRTLEWTLPRYGHHPRMGCPA